MMLDPSTTHGSNNVRSTDVLIVIILFLPNEFEVIDAKKDTDFKVVCQLYN